MSVFGLGRVDDGNTKGDANDVGAPNRTDASRANFPGPSQLYLMGLEHELISLVLVS